MLTTFIMQKSAHEVLDPHQVVIGDRHLMLLPMVLLIHFPGLDLVVLVEEVTAAHLKMVI